LKVFDERNVQQGETGGEDKSAANCQITPINSEFASCPGFPVQANDEGIQILFGARRDRVRRFNVSSPIRRRFSALSS
jgi:hypothetical protein